MCWFIPYAFPLCWICFSYLTSCEFFSWNYAPVLLSERVLRGPCYKLSGNTRKLNPLYFVCYLSFQVGRWQWQCKRGYEKEIFSVKINAYSAHSINIWITSDYRAAYLSIHYFMYLLPFIYRYIVILIIDNKFVIINEYHLYLSICRYENRVK